MSETPRVLRANRAQLELRPTDLESLLPEDHRARVVWEFVEGHAWRPAIDAAILLALWNLGRRKRRPPIPARALSRRSVRQPQEEETSPA